MHLTILLASICIHLLILDVDCENNDDMRMVNYRFRRAATNVQTQCNYSYVPYLDTCDVCGNVTYSQNARIVGGSRAVAYSWPAQVYIVQNIKGIYWIGTSFYSIDISYVCGGTLINRYTILTAGHCINTEFEKTISGSTYTIKVHNPYDASQYTVYLGAYNIDNLGSAQKRSLWKVIRHPSYNSGNFLNDLSLYLLSTQATLNDNVQPACLPDPAYGTTTYPASSATVFASGWGTLSEGGSNPSYLYNVRMTTYASSSCSLVETGYTKNWDAQICAGLYTGGKDTCQGDSGGGLYTFDSAYSKYIVVGITSYGEGCGRYGKPGIYTRTAYYYDWITKNWATSNAPQQQQVPNNLLLSFAFIFISVFF